MAVDTGPQALMRAGARGVRDERDTRDERAKVIDGPAGAVTIVQRSSYIEVHYSVPPNDHAVWWVTAWLDAKAPCWQVTEHAYTDDGLVGIVTLAPPA